MYFRSIDAKDNTRAMTSVFMGYNHNEVIADGELYDTKNLTLDRYPVLSPRRKRAIELEVYNREWKPTTTSLSAEYYGQVTEAWVKYRATNDTEIDEKTNYRISICFDDTVLQPSDFVITQLDKNDKKLKEDVIKLTGDRLVSSGTQIDLLTVDGCTKLDFYMKCLPITLKNFKEEEALDLVNGYVHGFLVEEFVDDVRGMIIKNNKLSYLIRTNFYYGREVFDFDEILDEEEHTSDVQFISFGTKILIFPLNVYFDCANKSYGRLDAAYTTTAKVTLQMCDYEGENLSVTNVGKTAPNNPTDGMYWISTKEESAGLYQWIASMNMWKPVMSTYIKISCSGIGAKFSEGDAVYMNTPYEDINEGSVIRKKANDYIVVSGIMKAGSDTISGIKVERKVPQLDYVCVSNNRVWGCRFDGTLNEIYASKLGDAFNWYVYDGAASDSYTISIASDGDFTGCIAFQGQPMFFKENVVYAVYGAYPAAYQLYTYDCRGVQKGSSKSLAVVGEYLMYKSEMDICVFDGSNPVSVSKNLGSFDFVNAAAGSCNHKYYVSMFNENLGEWNLFTYDIDKGMWMKEDNLRIKQFAYSNSGQLYGNDRLVIYGFEKSSDALNQANKAKEDSVSWEAITCAYGYDMPDKSYLSRLSIRADIPYDAELQVLVSYDDGKFLPIKTIRGNNTVASTSFAFTPNRCDHYRLKLKGHGDVKVYSIARTFDIGGEES